VLEYRHLVSIGAEQWRKLNINKRQWWEKRFSLSVVATSGRLGYMSSTEFSLM
jgi:hypothetical protein